MYAVKKSLFFILPGRASTFQINEYKTPNSHRDGPSNASIKPMNSVTTGVEW